jgi:hypothetical protein
MSIEELMKQFKGLWIAVRVVERDKAGQPLTAEVVASNLVRSNLLDEIYAEKDICIFFAGPIPEEGYVAMF